LQDERADYPRTEGLFLDLVRCLYLGLLLGYEYFVLRASLDGSSQILSLPDKRHARLAKSLASIQEALNANSYPRLHLLAPGQPPILSERSPGATGLAS
jgi:hypothetical protein